MVNGGCDGRAAEALGVPAWLARDLRELRDVPVEACGEPDRGRGVPRRPWDRLGDTPGVQELAAGGILAAALVAPGLLALLHGPELLVVDSLLVAAAVVAMRRLS